MTLSHFWSAFSSVSISHQRDTPVETCWLFFLILILIKTFSHHRDSLIEDRYLFDPDTKCLWNAMHHILSRFNSLTQTVPDTMTPPCIPRCANRRHRVCITFPGDPRVMTHYIPRWAYHCNSTSDRRHDHIWSANHMLRCDWSGNDVTSFFDQSQRGMSLVDQSGYRSWPQGQDSNPALI